MNGGKNAMSGTARLIGITMLAACVAAGEGTLAYWPLDTFRSEADLRDIAGLHSLAATGSCAVTPSFRMPLAVLPAYESLPAASRGEGRNRGSVLFSGVPAAELRAAGLGRALVWTNAFTVEGWVRCADDPAEGVSWPLFGAGRPGTGWRVALCRDAQGPAFVLHADAAADRLTLRHRFRDVTKDASYVWRHMCLTYDGTGAGCGVWEFFVNRVSLGVATNPVRAVCADLPGGFFLGGAGEADDAFYGQMDLWRVSAGVLPPAAWLCAAVPRTLAYWPMDRLPNGTPDLRDLTGGPYALAPGRDGGISVAPEQVSGRLPTEPGLWRRSRPARANTGSVRLDGALGQRSLLVAPDLGLRCDLTNRFTVEGWFRKSANPTERFWQVVGARDNSNGWMLSLRPDAAAVRFHLHVSDVAQGGRLQFERSFVNADVTACTNWCHLALTYDPLRNGVGVWELFLDGVSQGSVANPAPPDRSHGWRDLLLGGRPSLSNSFSGWLDCWRVSDSVLAPEQFLCHAADTVAAPRPERYTDVRRLDGSMMLPFQRARGRPFCMVLRDGSWLAVQGVEPVPPRSGFCDVAVSVSRDRGKTWSAPVMPVTVKGGEEVSAIGYQTPFGRIYLFWTDEAVRGYGFLFSDDGGVAWSTERLRLTSAAAGQTGGGMPVGIGVPVSLADGAVCLPLVMRREPDGAIEGRVAFSRNLYSERNAARVRFEVTESTGPGFRAMTDPGEGAFYCLAAPDGKTVCGIAGSAQGPVRCANPDGKGNGMPLEKLRFESGQTLAAVTGHVSAAVLSGDRMLLLWRGRSGERCGRGGSVWGSGARQIGDPKTRWSEPELLLYGDGAGGEVCLGSVWEQDNQCWLAVRQGRVVRAYPLDRLRTDGLWPDPMARSVSTNGLVFAYGGTGPTVVPAAFGAHGRPGWSVALWCALADAEPGAVLFSTWNGRRGLRVSMARSRGAPSLRLEAYDGNRRAVCTTAPGALTAEKTHQVAFVCDAACGRMWALAEGRFPEGGTDGGEGTAELPEGFGAVDVPGPATIAGRVSGLQLYDRPLRTAEVVGLARTGPIAP